MPRRPVRFSPSSEPEPELSGRMGAARALRERCSFENIVVLFSLPALLVWTVALYGGATGGLFLLQDLRFDFHAPADSPSVVAQHRAIDLFPQKVMQYQFSHGVVVVAKSPDVASAAGPAVRALTVAVHRETIGACERGELPSLPPRGIMPPVACWWREAYGLYMAKPDDFLRSDYLSADGRSASLIVLTTNFGVGPIGVMQRTAWTRLQGAIDEWLLESTDGVRHSDAYYVGSTHEQMLLDAASQGVVADFERGDATTLPIACLLLLLACGRAAILVLLTLPATLLASFYILEQIANGTWLCVDGYGPHGACPGYPRVALPTFCPAILINVLVALSLDYTLFILTRYNEELSRGASPLPALATTMRTTGRVVLISGATLCCCFVGLSFASTEFIAAVGWVGAVGCACAVVAHLTLLPALIFFLGPCTACKGPSPLLALQRSVARYVRRLCCRQKATRGGELPAADPIDDRFRRSRGLALLSSKPLSDDPQPEPPLADDSGRAVADPYPVIRSSADAPLAGSPDSVRTRDIEGARAPLGDIEHGASAQGGDEPRAAAPAGDEEPVPPPLLTHPSIDGSALAGERQNRSKLGGLSRLAAAFRAGLVRVRVVDCSSQVGGPSAPDAEALSVRAPTDAASGLQPPHGGAKGEPREAWVRVGLLCRAHRLKIIVAAALLCVPTGFAAARLRLDTGPSMLVPRHTPSLRAVQAISENGLSAGVLDPLHVVVYNLADESGATLPCHDDNVDLAMGVDLEIRSGPRDVARMLRSIPRSQYTCAAAVSYGVPLCDKTALDALQASPMLASRVKRVCPGTCPDYCREGEASRGGRSVLNARLFDEMRAFREQVMHELQLPPSAVRDVATLPHDRTLPLTWQEAETLLQPSNYAPGAAAYRASFERHTSFNASAAFIEVLLPRGQNGMGSLAAMKALRAIAARPQFADSPHGFEVYGDGVLMEDAVAQALDQAPRILSVVALVVILLASAVAFRSLLIPLRLLLTILVTLVWCAAAAVVVYQDLGGMDGVYWIVPLSCGPLVVGLTIDYDVYLIARVHEFRLAGYSTEAAILRAMATQSGSITTAGVLMTVAFSSLLLSSTAVLNQFGFVLVVASLIDTFVVRTLLVPALMFCVVDANWWPGRVPHAIFFDWREETGVRLPRPAAAPCSDPTTGT